MARHKKRRTKHSRQARLSSARVHIGDIPVDSGQIMIIDPGYIKANFATDHDATPGLNYAGACRTSLEHGCGEFGDPNRPIWGMVTTTIHGDGYFPVYATFDGDGNVAEVTVQLSWEQEKDDPAE